MKLKSYELLHFIHKLILSFQTDRFGQTMKTQVRRGFAILWETFEFWMHFPICYNHIVLIWIQLSCDMTKPTMWQCASEDSDQPGHPPSLIRVFTVRMKKPWVLSYPLSAQRRLWSDLADTHFVSFVMSWLNYGNFFQSVNFLDFYGNTWPPSWKKQQNDCAPSEDSDQPGHLPSLISLCLRSMGS